MAPDMPGGTGCAMYNGVNPMVTTRFGELHFSSAR